MTNATINPAVNDAMEERTMAMAMTVVLRPMIVENIIILCSSYVL